ncbi:MAG: PDZ domain-containing protein [Acidobacteriia bacterium]|nr:PDZ domain-containing protein [Terriglobia bacterium]
MKRPTSDKPGQMWGTIVFVFVLACSWAALAQTGAPPVTEPQAVGPGPGGGITVQVAYTISLKSAVNHIAHVAIRLRPLAPNRPYRVQLPVWNALYQVRDFAQYARAVAAHDDDGGAVPIRLVDKTTWEADIDSRTVTFEYDVVADNPGPFGAELNDRHAFFNLAEILMYPVDLRDGWMQVTFTDVPPAWKVATSLRQIRTNLLLARNYDELVDAPVELGTFQESVLAQRGAEYRVVVDADPSDYDMSAISRMAYKLAATEVEWMQDWPAGHYLFIYHFPRHPAGGGMEHADSTAIDAPAERVKANPLSLADVTAHEFFHLWNVKRIRPQSLEPVDYTKEQYTRALWFSEGVTSTVADFVRVRAGYLDEKGFLAELAADIRQLESRPARLTQSVEEASLDAWLEKYPAYELPERSISYYNKGEIVGLLLDLQMREVSGGKKSLRDLFHWMNEHYAKQGKFFPDSAGVREAAETVTGADFRDFFARYVSGVDAIPYDKFFATVGLRLQRQTITAADAGFRSVRHLGRPATVISVSPGSEAEKAGLRRGDTIQEVNGRVSEFLPETEISSIRVGDRVDLRIDGAGGQRHIKFKVGARPVENYILVEREDATATQRARRAAWMRGDSE